MAEKTILLSVGDDSGDLHAANLMRAARRAEPDLRFVGFGMERMAEAGLEALQPEQSTESSMLLRPLLQWRHYRERLKIACRQMDRGRVGLLIPVDFGGFNLCLCRQARRRGVPVFYYIPPQVWAHGRYRLKKLRKWTTRAGIIYPFEKPLYEQWDVPAVYVGSPLFDHLAQHPPREEVVEGLRERFGRRLVGVFPGSRRQEVRAHLPIVADACARIRRAVPEAEFAVVTTEKMRQEVEKGLAGRNAPIALLEDVRPTELAAAATLCVTKSGTVTLEIAGQGTPMVIFYRTSLLGRFLAAGLAEVPWIGLINVLAGEAVCPEKLMARDDSDWLAARTLEFLTDASARRECHTAIRLALDGYTEPGAAERAAQTALELL
ncbi:MAG: lipid-A-disaccharide synthase [Planctomycetota bacterium]